MISTEVPTNAKQTPNRANRLGTSAVAIVGMACRLPGANDYDTHWQDMLGGYELLTRLLPADLKLAGVPEGLARQASYRPVTSLVDCPGGIDAEFFGISPSEAAAMDPQHRVFLELCWAAMEDAGITPQAAGGHIAVLGGGGRHGYLRYVESGFADEDWLDGSIHGLQSDIGNYGDFLATRVSYRLGLTGPSLNVQTACSTGLMAVHLACRGIAAGEVEVALAGAVNVHTPQVSGYHYEEGSICSAAGRLRPFDERADGSVFGNGGGAVLLKSLNAAARDGDRIIAIIRSTACNNDGNDKVSYTAPSVSGQAAAIADALHLADVDPASIGYVEAHGTGTPLGDPIEIQALNQAFNLPGGSRTCALGTAKSQIGHLGPAAGIIGLIRAALVVERAVIPRCVNFEVPSSRISWHDGPFYVPTVNTPWVGHRRAGVSAFGVGGTNVHAVLEQAPTVERTAKAADRPLPVVLSAQTSARLRELRRRLADHLDRNPSLRIEDVSRTLNLGRVSERLRASWAAADVADLSTQLRHSRAEDVLPESPDLPVVLAFPGQGDQYAGAGEALYHNDPVFAGAVDECAATLQDITGFDIRTVMFPAPGELPVAAARIHRAQRAQEALFVFEYSLGRALIEAGLSPSAMIGHSAGEYPAAVLSGILSLADASRLVATRGRLMEHEVPAGAMMAVGLAEEELIAVLPDDLDLAAINAPGQCVVSGTVDAIARFEEKLVSDDLLNRVLGTSVAAHSRLVDGVLGEFTAVVERLRFGRPTIPMASTLLGAFECSDALTEPGYWTAHLRQPVRFMAAAEAVLAQGRAVVLEVGPGRATTGMFRQLDDGINLPVLALWRKGHPEPASIAEVVGHAWELGARVHWGHGLSSLSPRSVRLPGRKHQRSTPWTTTGRSPEPALPRLVEQPWIWAPRWAVAPVTATANTPEKCVVITTGSAAWAEDLDAEVTVINVPTCDDATVRERLTAAEDAVRTADAVVFVARAVPAGSRPTETVLTDNFWPLLRAGAAVAEMRAGRHTPLLVVMPAEEGTTDPELELVVGPCRVLPQEYPDLEVSLVRGEPSASLVEDELGAFEADGDIAYVNGRRCRRTYERIEAPLGPEPWRSGSTYLITGGTGGIGLALADAMAATSAVRLVLTRRPRPAGSVRDDDMLEQRLRRLRRQGLVVEVVDVDVRDEAGMRELRDRFGPFDGIVHAAGVASGMLVSALDTDHVTSVVSPKVDGTQVLKHVVADDATRWIALCSSMSSRIGGIGHADYSSANAYLDAWAEQATARGPRVVSLGYDALTESGMAVNAARKAKPTDDGSLRVWHTSMPAADWRRQEHVVDGQPILPGTGIIELVYRAARELLGLEFVELRGLDLLRPTGGSADAELAIDIEFVARKPDWAVTVRCAEAGSAPLTTATCTVAMAEPLASVERQPPSPWPDGDEARQDEPTASGTRLVRFGPRWDCAGGTRPAQDGRIEARSVLAEAFDADLPAHPLHPALLDNALGASLTDLDDQYVPMSYERIVVWRPLPRDVRSLISTRSPAADVISLDVECLTPIGEPLLEVRGYQLRRIEPGRLAGPAVPGGRSRTLRQRIPGDVNSLRFEAAPQPTCAPGEVIVEVRATGLNFKEALIAAGLLDHPEGYRFGLECAGVVVVVGAQVESLRVGDAVFGLGEACFDDFVTMPARLVRQIPRGLNFEQSATIPVAFTTAYDCMVDLARARPGETVLVHAVTGGVGSAAAQIARHLGLTVFGTASTPEKRELALAMGVAEVFDSRSLDFEREVIDRGGVDIVLNSLGGEFIEAGLRCLRAGGRFVEMGRRDILSGRPLDMELFSRGTTFAAYYPDVESPRYESTLDEVSDLLRESAIRPLPYRTFPEESVTEAFLYMSRAEHIGKVVVVKDGSQERSCSDGYPVDDGGITDDLAVSALKRAVQLGEPCVLVTARDVREARTGLVVAGHVLDDEQTDPGQPATLELVGLEGDVERRLGQIWANVLRLDTVSRDDTFVGLGGDSLYATQVVGRVSKEFGQRIAPAVVLGTATLAELARTLEAGTARAMD
ncbi:SDR family NAD(P)-dependent oxidoreductase [Actinophytocola glycyrrhizae]|uniref:SDR family NAD(P)-dependent oxidoreductase n=1 Tax=Actinophytocola glycyrrhizae TaxID=2044873 RepID=A0ABV9SER1_9PSEU